MVKINPFIFVIIFNTLQLITYQGIFIIDQISLYL